MSSDEYIEQIYIGQLCIPNKYLRKLGKIYIVLIFIILEPNEGVEAHLIFEREEVPGRKKYSIYAR